MTFGGDMGEEMGDVAEVGNFGADVAKKRDGGHGSDELV
jgi:hypothetical protein